MEDEYMIFESKMNHLTLEELNRMESNSISVLKKKIKHLAETQNKASETIFNRLASIISVVDLNASLMDENMLGLSYYPKKKLWRARRDINGKRIHIKSSQDVEKVKEALLEFCKKHCLDVR